MSPNRSDTPAPADAAASGAFDVAAARRAEIIAAAHELYQERGLSKTSIKDVTERVGVTRTLFYHYFPDKDALTSAVLDAYIDEFEAHGTDNITVDC